MIPWFLIFFETLTHAILTNVILHSWEQGGYVAQHFAPRSKTLSEGFMAELSARRTSLTTSKTDLETLYSQTMGDDTELKKKVDLVERINKAVLACDASSTSLSGTIRSIKLAVESWDQLHFFEEFGRMWINIQHIFYFSKPPGSGPSKAWWGKSEG